MVMVKWPSIWNAADLKKKIWNSEVGTTVVRSAPGRDRAEAGFIEALNRNATRKARRMSSRVVGLPLDICLAGGVLPPVVSLGCCLLLSRSRTGDWRWLIPKVLIQEISVPEI
jgi:hypothetical protein